MARTRSSPIAIEGLPFVIPLGIVTAVLLSWGWFYVGVCFFALTVFGVYFFRNPRRVIPPSDQLILSPADGRVVEVSECLEERFFRQETTKVSVFMSLFNVHINRSPMSGVVEEKSYTPGRFFSANKDRSSRDNEQNAVVIRGKDDVKVLLIQIAGLIARRIVCYPEKGDRIEKGQILGLIRFGSRLDVYLPEGVEAVVKIGDKVRGGESVLGTIP